MKINFKKGAFISFCLLFVFIPFSISISEGCFAAAVIFFVLAKYREAQIDSALNGGNIFKRFKFQGTPIDTSAILFFAACVLSLLSVLIRAPDYAGVAIQGLFKVFKWYLLFYVAIELFDSPKRIQTISKVIMLVGIVVLMDALFQLFFGFDITGRSSSNSFQLPRVRAGFTYENAFASYLVMVLPYLLIVWFTFSQEARTLWRKGFVLFADIPLLLVVFICFAQTRTRGAWLALMGGLLFVTLLRKRSKRVLSAAVLIIVIVCLTPAILNYLTHNVHLDRSTGITIYSVDETVFSYSFREIQERLRLWSEALHILADHLFLGAGPNTYAKVAPYYKSVEYGGAYPHNSYLKIAAETGLLGITSFLFVLYLLMRYLGGAVKRFQSDENIFLDLLSAAIVGLFGFLIKALVDTEFESLQRVYTFWFFAGLGVAIVKVMHKTPQFLQGQKFAEEAKVKVLHVGNALSIQRLISPHMNDQLKKGFDVSALTSKNLPLDSFERANVVQIDFREQSIHLLKDVEAFIKLMLVLKKIRPDIVHTHSVKFGVFGRIAARLVGVPRIIHTAHGIYRPHNVNAVSRFCIDMLERWSSLFCDKVLFVSRFDMQTYVASRVVSAAKAFLIGNGIDLERFDPSRYAPEVVLDKKKELGISQDAFVVGMVARLVADKGCVEFFETAKRLLAKTKKKIVFLIATLSYMRDDSLSENIVLQHGLRDNVIVLKDRNDMPSLYMAMDVLIHPSWREGFPRVLMEASAMGVPCVASDIPGNRNVIDDKVTGVLFEVRNAESLHHACRWSIEHEAELKVMAKRAQKKAREEFDQRIMFEKIDQVYHQLLNSQCEWLLAKSANYEMV